MAASTGTACAEKQRVEGRDDKGRFAKGNKGGPGNPYARKMAALKKALMDYVQPEDIVDVAIILLLKAKQGDHASVKLLFSYLLGLPKDQVDPDRLDQGEWQIWMESVIAEKDIGRLDLGMPIDRVNDLAAERMAEQRAIFDSLYCPMANGDNGQRTPSANGSNGGPGRRDEPTTNGSNGAPARGKPTGNGSNGEHGRRNDPTTNGCQGRQTEPMTNGRGGEESLASPMRNGPVGEKGQGSPKGDGSVGEQKSPTGNGCDGEDLEAKWQLGEKPRRIFDALTQICDPMLERARDDYHARLTNGANGAYLKERMSGEAYEEAMDLVREFQEAVNEQLGRPLDTPLERSWLLRGEEADCQSLREYQHLLGQVRVMIRVFQAEQLRDEDETLFQRMKKLEKAEILV